MCVSPNEAFPEELIFRGYIYANLSERFHGYWVVLLQTLLFMLWGAAIGSTRSIDRVILFFAISWLTGSLRMISGNVWVGIGFHTAFQTIAQLLLNDSYGFFRIEGVSILQLVAFSLLPFLCTEILARLIYSTKIIKQMPY